MSSSIVFDAPAADTVIATKHALIALLLIASSLLAADKVDYSFIRSNVRVRATPADSLQRRGLAGGAPEPNVAWLMSGSVRTLPLPFVYKTIKRNAFDAFGGRVYIFGYLKTEESPDLMFIDDWNVHSATSKTTRRFGSLNPVIAHLGFDVVEVVHNLNDTSRVNSDCDFMTSRHHIEMRPRHVGQMLTLAKAWQQLLRFERERGISFDFVMRVRPDVAFLQPIPSWHSWVHSAAENRAAGLGGPGPGLGMHTWIAGLKLDAYVMDYRERSGAQPGFIAPENCFVRPSAVSAQRIGELLLTSYPAILTP